MQMMMGPRMLSNRGMGGYDISSQSLYTKNGANMRESDTEALKCGLCFNVLRDPIQLLTCGCRYCNSCVHAMMEKESGYVC
jgi:late competence protein required for DNA uptake (superfamily II DNA/RNA helicase)